MSSSSRHSVVTGEQQVCACACEAITPTVTDLFENSINFSAIHDFQISRKKTYIVLSYSAKIDGVKDYTHSTCDGGVISHLPPVTVTEL